jgi:hypothetical protein
MVPSYNLYDKEDTQLPPNFTRTALMHVAVRRCFSWDRSSLSFVAASPPPSISACASEGVSMNVSQAFSASSLANFFHVNTDVLRIEIRASIIRVTSTSKRFAFFWTLLWYLWLTLHPCALCRHNFQNSITSLLATLVLSVINQCFPSSVSDTSSKLLLYPGYANHLVVHTQLHGQGTITVPVPPLPVHVLVSESCAC